MTMLGRSAGGVCRRRVMSSLVAASMLAGLVSSETSAATPDADPRIVGRVVQLLPPRVGQYGPIPEGASEAKKSLGTLFIANETVIVDKTKDASSAAILVFDLSGFKDATTPSARLTLPDLAKLPVKRPGERPSAERGALHVFWSIEDAHKLKPAASMPLKPGFAATYVLDVTDAVNQVLATPGKKMLQFNIHAAGKPQPYEVYGLPYGGENPPSLELVSEPHCIDDFEARISPIDKGSTVYREAALPLVEDRAADAEIKTLYPINDVVEVVRNLTGEKLKEGTDWEFRDGKLFVKAGSQAIQYAPEFFAVERKDKDGNVTTARNAIQLMEGTWYQERQIEVTYEPAIRDWQMPAPLSSLAELPRTKKLLEAKQPLSIILFGDSISAGGNASRFQGGRPWQQSYGDLVVRKLREQYGAPITYMNHSRGGATSGYALTQIDSQVAWFKPDLVILAYGMNDRGDGRREIYRENLERMIAAVRARSPETEFVIVTPMLNSSKQPTGLDPVLFIRDEALKIKGPGIAHVDVTSTHLKMLDRKDYLDTSGNGANHPNDFLQRIYAQKVLEVLLPR